VGTVDVVFGQVMRIHVDDRVLTPEGRLDIPTIRPIARMGYHDYAVISETFEMCIPGASEAEAAGLEGRAT
jgi:flavin reductase (DIM6/NTAB) family NADH-FMN oxidoreductase RutF